MAMPNVEAEEALRLAERIRIAIESYPFQHGETHPQGKITICGGVASYPMDGSRGNELIKHADEALYQAKEAGRNRVRRYRGVNIGDVGAEARAAVWNEDREAG